MDIAKNIGIFLFIFHTFVWRHSFYYFVRGYLCAQYAITNPVESLQTAVCRIFILSFVWRQKKVLQRKTPFALLWIFPFHGWRTTGFLACLDNDVVQRSLEACCPIMRPHPNAPYIPVWLFIDSLDTFPLSFKGSFEILWFCLRMTQHAFFKGELSQIHLDVFSHTFFCWATIVLPLCKGIFMRSIRHYQPCGATSNGGEPYPAVWIISLPSCCGRHPVYVLARAVLRYGIHAFAALFQIL